MAMGHNNRVLLIIDVQNDFCTGGALAVRDGEGVIPVINGLRHDFDHCVLTQDWHPGTHFSFAANHEGGKEFTTITAPYGAQTLWPVHCVWGSIGAEFHNDLRTDHARLIVRKGYRREIDSYSAFFENDRTTPTGLAGYFHDHAIKEIVMVGLAFDFCVGFSALDARALGFKVRVLVDGCRSIDLDGSHCAMEKRLISAGVDLWSSSDI